ncbi:MAG: transposase [Sarcina sp.]
MNLNLNGEFDEKFDLLITRKQTNEIKNNPQLYKFLPSNSNFDYLDCETKYYKILFRLVRFKLSEDNYETLITNMDKAEFSVEILKDLYHMRWGIEISFRELKYSIGLVNLHSKKRDFIIQEIYAKLTMYNFCSMIISNIIVSKKETIYEHQVNFTMAMHISKEFLKSKIKKYTVEL